MPTSIFIALALTGQLASRYGEAANAPAPAGSAITIAPRSAAPTLADAQSPALARTPLAAAANAEALATQAPTTAGPQLTASNVPSVKPSELLQSLSQPARSRTLSGMPLTLADALQGASSRRQQTERTIAYWQLSAAATELSLADRESTELQALRQEVVVPSPQWQSQLQRAAARLDLAAATVATAQQRMQRLSGVDGAATPPIAADAPHCGRYETRFSEIFAGRESLSAAQLNDLLARRYDELCQLAQSEAAALEWLGKVRASRDRNSDGAELLMAHELLSLERRQFVDAVAQYNQEIAAYAELAAPGALQPERLTAMLIRTTKEPTLDPQYDDQFQTAGAETVDPPATFAPPNAEQVYPQNVPPRSALRQPPPQNQQQPLATQPRQVRKPIFPRLFGREHSILRRR